MRSDEVREMSRTVNGKMGFSVPLNALRAFEAAARHMSIKEAAFELSLTPSATGSVFSKMHLGVNFSCVVELGRASNSRKPERHLHRR